MGNIDYGAQETPLIYPVYLKQQLKIITRYPEFTEEQQELISYSRAYLSRALNSPYYQLFKKSSNSHSLLDQSEKCANEFIQSLIKQRPFYFPEELKKKVKFSKDRNLDTELFVGDDESDKEKSEEKEEIESNEDSELPGIWEDGKESDHMDSEEII